MYSQGQEKASVGRVNIDIKGKSYRIRFTYPQGQRHEFTIARVSDEGWSTATRAAQLINRDIDLGDFDNSYARYSPKHAKKLKIQQAESKPESSLLKIWETYKEIKEQSTSESTKKREWKRIDNLLKGVDKKLLQLDKAEELINHLLSKYSVGTLNPRLRILYAAVNTLVKQQKIGVNPYLQIHSPYKKKKSKPECFEIDEIKAIIAAFESDEFKPPESPYSHSYYTPLVQFLALTGCRPSEAHALTWNDIKRRNGKTFIRFNKVFTNNLLINNTKTHEVRLFPCNQQITGLIASLPRVKNDNDLIFPSVGLGHINQNNFRRRYWQPVVKGLVKQGKIDKYLKPYCLRHSFITRLVRDGVDIATVASLSGNSPQIIMTNYLASNQDFELPEL
jgi:integrase